MNKPLLPVYEFGEFKLDPAHRILLRAGAIVPLTPKAFDTLLVLVRHGGNVVGKDELMREVWPDTFVEENSLARNISVLRRLLEDGHDTNVCIETVPKRGYRFVRAVSAHAPEATPFASNGDAPGRPLSNASVVADPVPESLSETSASQPGRFPGRPTVVALGALLFGTAVIAIGGAAWMRGQQGATSAATSSPSANVSASPRAPVAHLAVLPLHVLTAPDAHTPYLSVGLPDSITTRLSGIGTLRLRPTTMTWRYADGKIDARRAGQELGVAHVLAGTLRMEPEGYRVNLQLVRVADGVTIWGQPYVIGLRRGAGPTEEAVAARVVDALKLQLTLAERERVQRRYTENAAAYALFLQGRTRFLTYTEARMREAVDRFEAALRVDPGYALARASLAMALASYSVRYAGDDAHAWAARAEKEALRALESDPDLADAHLALAHAAGTIHYGFDWARVLAETDLALARDPTLDVAHTVRARAFYHLGLFDLAEQQTRLAIAVPKDDGIENARIRIVGALYSGRFAEAQQQARELMKLTDASQIPMFLGLSTYYLGDGEQARTILAGVRRGGRYDSRTQAALAAVEAALGNRPEAERLVRAVLAQPNRDHHVSNHLGQAYAQLGNTSEALRWLQEAADTGFPCFPYFVQDPLLNPLRKQQPFITWLERQRRDHEAARDRYQSGT